MMKPTESAKYLNVLLNLLGFFVIIVIIAIATKGFRNINRVEQGVAMLMALIYSLGYFTIVLMLKRVVGTILFTRNPFVEENVIRFKRVGYTFFILAAFEVIRAGMSLSEAFKNSVPGGQFVGSLFMTLFMGCVMLVLADVFKFAMKIKEDNDLTV